MSKLQLYIFKSLGGFECVRNINPADSIQSHIRDVRGALESLDYDASEIHIFYMLNYVEEGTLLSVLRTIPDEAGNHLAMNIFIPAGLEIEANELGAIVERTARMVSKAALTADDLAELHELFSKDYPCRADEPKAVPSVGEEYAVCYYGGDTGRELTDFMGKHLYQTGFIKFAGVMLIDADASVSTDLTDLSGYPLCEPSTLLPPEHVDEFVPYVYGRPFDRPFKVSVGEAVDVVWKRAGFDDKHQTVDVVDSEQVVEAESFDDSRKNITRAMFLITSQGSRQPITDAEITVNGVSITDNHPFSHDELKSARVVVNAPGFQPYEATLNLAATSRAMIQLPEQRKVFRFELPVKSSELGAPIHFEIHTKRNLTESPIEGYSLLDDIKEGVGRNNHLEYTGARAAFTMQQGLIYAAGALLIGFLLGWLIMGGSGGSATEEVELTETVDSAEVSDDSGVATKSDNKAKTATTTNSGKNSSAAVAGDAVKYLDNNTRWTSEGMSAYPELAGLFDDMNNYRLEKLSGEWATKLSKSTRFKKVAEHSTYSLQKKHKPEGKYLKEGDKTISVQSYLNTIDP